MMKTGIDIVEISRFREMQNLDDFIKRVFTPKEQEYFSAKKNRYESIAGIYAAKEAFSKYLGTGIRGFNFKDIEVVHDALGKPKLYFMGKFQNADLSISHTKTTAVAVVCGEEEEKRIEGIDRYRELLPNRTPNMHKGDCGRVFLIAGSVGMTGAATLSALGALRCGSGLVTVGTPAEAQPVLATKLTEAMTLPLPKDGALSLIKEQIQKSDVIAIGPGLGKTLGVAEMLKIVLESGKPVVIDADGINVLAEHINMLEGEHGDVVLTPHPGEMARLLGKSVPENKECREEIAKTFAQRYGVTLLLKGKDTVVASPDGAVEVNPTGNSGMATGGMGDVLTGVVASWMGQGLDGYSAAVLGAFLHGLAGDFTAKDLGEFGMIAGDVAERLPKAILTLQT